jgi:hypothetical protein
MSKKKASDLFRDVIGRLDASLSTNGVDALDKMSGLEVHVLLAEKRADLQAAENRLAKDANDKGAKAQQQKADRDVKLISGYIDESRERSRKQSGLPDPDERSIHRMLDDVEAVTKSRFYHDPEPFMSPIEVFRMQDGKRGGEPFASLSNREKWQVLGDYSGWTEHEKRGIDLSQMDKVFANVINGKPKEQWLEGTGLSLSPDPKAVAAKLRAATPKQPIEPQKVKCKEHDRNR